MLRRSRLILLLRRSRRPRNVFLFILLEPQIRRNILLLFRRLFVQKGVNNRTLRCPAAILFVVVVEKRVNHFGHRLLWLLNARKPFVAPHLLSRQPFDGPLLEQIRYELFERGMAFIEEHADELELAPFDQLKQLLFIALIIEKGRESANQQVNDHPFSSTQWQPIKHSMSTNQKVQCQPIKRCNVNQSKGAMATNQKVQCQPIKRCNVNQSKGAMATNQRVQCQPIKSNIFNQSHSA